MNIVQEKLQRRKVLKKEAQKRWTIKNMERKHKYLSDYYKNPKNTQRLKDYSKAWKAEHHDRERGYKITYLKKLKWEVLSHYGGSPPKCCCCDEWRMEFLTLDHVRGDGNKRRKETNTAGGCNYYAKVRKEGYPLGYQVLCFNCNIARGQSGHCPHERERTIKAKMGFVEPSDREIA